MVTYVTLFPLSASHCKSTYRYVKNAQLEVVKFQRERHRYVTEQFCIFNNVFLFYRLQKIFLHRPTFLEGRSE